MMLGHHRHQLHAWSIFSGHPIVIYHKIFPDWSRSYFENFFNFSMSYRLDAELHHGYGELVPVSPHPGRGENLTEIMIQFGQQNKHLARKQPGERKDKTFACIFVSNCQTKSHRNAFVFFQRYYLTNYKLNHFSD